MVAEFTRTEVELLNEILVQAHKDLAIEIHRTDSLAYREGLVERQATLESIQKSLRLAQEVARV